MTAQTEPLTTEEVRDLVSRISYKPDHVMTVEADLVRDCVYFQVRLTRPNSRNGAPTSPGTFTAPIPEYMWHQPTDQQGWLWWIRLQLVALESHEVDEWFALDGFVVGSPHGEVPGSIPVRNNDDPWNSKYINIDITLGRPLG